MTLDYFHSIVTVVQRKKLSSVISFNNFCSRIIWSNMNLSLNSSLNI